MPKYFNFGFTMEPLKNLYSPAFYTRLAGILTHTVPGFDAQQFKKLTVTKALPQMELKERMKHTTQALHHFMPADFGKAAGIIDKTIARLRQEKFGEYGLVFMFLPDYIETHGLNDYAHAVKALEKTTQFISCEFAVRPFILKYGSDMLQQMQQWSLHKNEHVRRLASEGSRPRLPWAMAIPHLKKDPSPVLPILENLKNDASEYVRRSVANNLNDIAKDHPHIVLDIARKWKGHSPQTDAIVKHGSRTLLKQGHPEILDHYGLSAAGLKFSNFRLHTPVVRIGQTLEFSFTIANENSGGKITRLEYAVYYRKQNGQLSKKVFKISEREYLPGQKENIRRNQKFVIITTRTFYPGQHKIAVIVNGAEQKAASFELVK